MKINYCKYNYISIAISVDRRSRYRKVIPDMLNDSSRVMNTDKYIINKMNSYGSDFNNSKNYTPKKNRKYLKNSIDTNSYGNVQTLNGLT